MFWSTDESAAWVCLVRVREREKKKPFVTAAFVSESHHCLNGQIIPAALLFSAGFWVMTPSGMWLELLLQGRSFGPPPQAVGHLVQRGCGRKRGRERKSLSRNSG